MANGDHAGAVDHEARRNVATLLARHEACTKTREEREMAIEQTLRRVELKVDEQGKYISETNGALRAWKILIPVCMLLIAAVTLIVGLSK